MRRENEIAFLKHIENTDMSYGFTYGNEPVVLFGEERVKISDNVGLYVMCLLNLEDWDRQMTIQEKYEINLLIVEKLGISKVIEAIKFFTRRNDTIEGKMELVMIEAFPYLKEDIKSRCDKIRSKYGSLDGIA